MRRHVGVRRDQDGAAAGEGFIPIFESRVGLRPRMLQERRDVLQDVSGFDESLPESLADVDLCLKMQRAGYLIVYTPFAKLYWHAPQHETADARSDAIMLERWRDVLQRDPYYNPNLSRERADFSLGK